MDKCRHEITRTTCALCRSKPTVRRVQIHSAHKCTSRKGLYVHTGASVRAETLAAFAAKWGWMFVRRAGEARE